MRRERLFAAMILNAGSVVEYFRIPPNRAIELGTQVESRAAASVSLRLLASSF